MRFGKKAAQNPAQFTEKRKDQFRLSMGFLLF
jgi:hypothetical protein